jgi:hypothetical protein
VPAADGSKYEQLKAEGAAVVSARVQMVAAMDEKLSALQAAAAATAAAKTDALKATLRLEPSTASQGSHHCLCRPATSAAPSPDPRFEPSPGPWLDPSSDA